MAYDYNDLAATLSPTQFELLLRTYMQRQLSVNYTVADHVQFSWPVNGNKPGDWIVSSWRGGADTKTQGELLSLCCAEHSRRKAADAANTLLLLEHVPVDEPNAPQPFIEDDAIPF